MSLKVKLGTLFVVAIAVYFYRRRTEDDLKENVLTALLAAENKVPPNPQTRVAVGFGACQDIIADGLDVFNSMGAEAPEVPDHFNDILNLEMLEKSFAYFFQHGAAAE